MLLNNYSLHVTTKKEQNLEEWLDKLLKCINGDRNFKSFSFSRHYENLVSTASAGPCMQKVQVQVNWIFTSFILVCVTFAIHLYKTCLYMYEWHVQRAV